MPPTSTRGSSSTAAASRCVRCKGLCWFDFAALCEGPRGNADYIEIARASSTPCWSAASRAWAATATTPRRFVHLVDELYDNQVNLVCTADAGPMGLYTGERLVAASNARLRAWSRCSPPTISPAPHRAERSGTPVRAATA